MRSHTDAFWAKTWRERSRWLVYERNPAHDDGQIRRMLQAMQAHREFHPLWDRLDELHGQPAVVGGINALLHVSLHATVQTQCETGDPAQALPALRALEDAGFSHHRAEHVLMHALTLELADVMSDPAPSSPTRYAGRLGLIELRLRNPQAFAKRIRETARNAPCICGSTIKFKRCCRDWLSLPLAPTAWAMSLPDAPQYCTTEYLGQAADDDPTVLLQNTAAVAYALERLGDLEGGLAALRQMSDLVGEVEETRDQLVPFRHNVFQHFWDFAMNHGRGCEEAIALADRLLAAGGMDAQARLILELARADLLARAGQRREADAVYTRALTGAPARLQQEVARRKTRLESLLKARHEQ